MASPLKYPALPADDGHLQKTVNACLALVGSVAAAGLRVLTPCGVGSSRRGYAAEQGAAPEPGALAHTAAACARRTRRGGPGEPRHTPHLAARRYVLPAPQSDSPLSTPPSAASAPPGLWCLCMPPYARRPRLEGRLPRPRSCSGPPTEMCAAAPGTGP